MLFFLIFLLSRIIPIFFFNLHYIFQKSRHLKLNTIFPYFSLKFQIKLFHSVLWFFQFHNNFFYRSFLISFLYEILCSWVYFIFIYVFQLLTILLYFFDKEDKEKDNIQCESLTANSWGQKSHFFTIFSNSS